MGDLDHENVHVVKRLFEDVWIRGDASQIAELVHDPAAIQRGMEKVLQLRQAFPDLRFETERFETESSFVIVYYKAHGTHTGELMGRPPTNKAITFEGSNIYRIRDGKIAEGWGHLNTQDPFRALFQSK